MAQRTSSVLNRTKNIGEFIADEYSEDEERELQSRAAPTHYLAGVMGLGLSLALWFGMTSLMIPFPYDFLPLLTP